MYCRKCGAVLKDSAKFCDSCGSEVIKVKQRSYAQKYNDNKIKQKWIIDTLYFRYSCYLTLLQKIQRIINKTLRSRRVLFNQHFLDAAKINQYIA